MNSTFRLSPRRGGLLAKLLLALVVVFALGAIAWAVLLPSIAASTIRSKTGFAVKLDALSVNPFTAKVHLRGAVIQNPEGWPERAFVELRDFRADADLFPLLGGKFMADDVVVDVARVTLVRNRDGVLNAVAFKDGLLGEKPADAPKPGEPAKKTEFLIRHLTLKFDQLVYADHSGRSPSVRSYDLGISREMENVDSIAKLATPFSGAALAVVSDALGGLFPAAAGLLQSAGGLLKDGGGLLKDGGKQAGETLKGLMQQLEKKKP